MSAAGIKNNKGGGRPGHGIDLKVAKFKDIAWDFILKECKDKQKLEGYVKLFANRLMPQVVEGSGNGGAIKLEIIGSKYDNIVKRENVRINRGTASTVEDSGS